MPNATPEMVDQISTLEGAVITKDGAAPLPAQTAEPSVPASTGATPEPAPAPADKVTAPDATPAVEPAPAPTPTLAQSRPSIEVIPGKQPVAAPAPVEPAPAAPVEAPVEPAPVAGPTEAERAQSLADYGKTQAEEGRRVAQGIADKQTAQLGRQLEEAKTATKDQAKQIRELQTGSLSDEDKAVALAKFEQDDERDALNEYRQNLVDFHRTVYIDSLSIEFAPYGVTREDLQAITTPEEMELACERAKSASLGKQLSTNGNTEVAPAVAEPVKAAEPTPAPPAPPAPVAAEANVPAGSRAPSDVGGGSVPAEAPTFNDKTDANALQENLGNMVWDQVKLPRT